MTSSHRKRKTSLEKAKLGFRITLIVGWCIAVVGVAIFTYSEAYPRMGKTPHQVGDLTLSQFGFWLIASGVGLVVVSVGCSQGLTCALNMIREENEALSVHAALGTGYEEEPIVDEPDTAPLIGPDKLQYGSTSITRSSPFSSRPRSVSVVTSSSQFSTQPFVAK